MESDEYETINSIENWLAGPLSGDATNASAAAPVTASSFAAQPQPVNHHYYSGHGAAATGFHYGAAPSPHQGLYGAVLNGGGVSQQQNGGVSPQLLQNYNSGVYGGHNNAVAGPQPPAGFYEPVNYNPSLCRGEGLHVSGTVYDISCYCDFYRYKSKCKRFF
jgi:hypothetical protein